MIHLLDSAGQVHRTRQILVSKHVCYKKKKTVMPRVTACCKRDRSGGLKPEIFLSFHSPTLPMGGGGDESHCSNFNQDEKSANQKRRR